MILLFSIDIINLQYRYIIVNNLKKRLKRMNSVIFSCILTNSKRMISSQWFYLLIRFIIGAVFIYAGFSKLIDPKAFARSISQFDIIPEILLAPLAIGLPALEFLGGIGLILNIRGSLTVIFNLLVLFILVLGYAIFNNMYINCGCLSTEEINAHNNLKQALFRDFLMVAAACYLYVFRRMTYKTNPVRSYGKI
jgi:uncharacterized membrane protein YphA (DoxX/SURF4 family)